MIKRIETIAEQVINGKRNPQQADEALVKALISANPDNRFQVIREAFARTIRIDENDALAGMNNSIAFWEDNISGGADVWTRLGELYESYSIYQNRLHMNGGNHKSANFEYVLWNGLQGHMDHIVMKKQSVTESDKTAFLDELYTTCEAVIAWCNAHADACRAAAENTTCGQRRKELQTMAAICEKVPRYPAESFREAVQSYWFMFMLFPDGLGRLDQYLGPFYCADIKKGVLSEVEALALIEELLMKIFCVLGTEHEWSANNHGVLAGYREDGTCGHNECTSLILKAVTELPTWRPQFSYRVTKLTTMQQFKEVLDANFKRPDLVMFLNDDVIVENLIKAGVAFQDAVNYSESGCNETIVTGCSQMGNIEGHINIVHSFERLMKNTESLDHFTSFEEFYQAYERELEKDLEVIFRLSYERDRLTAEYPDLIQSLFTDGCIESATSIHKGGAKYNYCTWCLTGIVNLADSMSIIRQMVFEEKRFTLAQIGQFVRNNWEGYEKERAYIQNNGRYFGNDDDYVDELLNQIGASVNEIAGKHTPYRGGRYLFGTLTGYELSHVVFGETSAATPDGRYDREPFAASIAAYPGADKNGMTSYLKSAAKIDDDVFASSVVVNLKLDRAMADSDEKRARLAAVFMTYLRLGGVQLQPNYLSADELINAQKEPDKYRSLRVRVTGFSGFFTNFDKNLQDELINRSLHVS